MHRMQPIDVRVEEVRDPQALHRYIHLPERLQGQRPNYVPPIWADERAFHDPGKNKVLHACRVIRFLAWQGDRCVGRIMGIIHDEYNQRHGERTARFYQLDVIDDHTVSSALIAAVEHWARGAGMERIIGPFGLSDKDPQGAQVEGFEHLPVLATPSNPAFLPAHIERVGYSKIADAVSYRTAIAPQLPPVYRRIVDRLSVGSEFRPLSITSKKQLKPWIVPVFRLVNATYKDLLGFVPLTEAEMRMMAAQYMPVLDAKLVKVVVDASNEPVAFVVAMPDMSEGIRHARGRMFPFGFLHVLGAMRRSRQLNLFLGAVRPDLQGRGLTCLLASDLLNKAHERGFTHMDSHLVQETNHRMCAELERLGGRVWKRYRIYGKDL